MDTLLTEIEFNPRVALMKASATLAMASRAKARKRAGHPVIALSSGEPDFDTPAEVSEAAIAAIREGFTHYTENRGMLALREAICEKLDRVNGVSYSPDEILCSNGAKQSVAQAISVLCRPGDEVLIPAPYWVSYPEMVWFAGGTPVVMPTSVESEYRITPDELDAAITDRTRIFMLCSPSNPTGSVYTPDELRAISDVLARHPHVFVISDEIYERIVFDVEHLSFASLPDMRERTITINGFSKSYAMTGWRLGYLAAPPKIVSEAAKIQSQFTSAPNSISQKAGIAALRMGPEPIEKMVAAFRKRRDFMVRAFSEMDHIRCPVPEGAFYVFPDVSSLYGKTTPSGERIEGSEHLCFYMLESFDVALVPGHAFGGEFGIRVSYAAAPAEIEEAAERIADAVHSLR
jgi:aspartate/methionine/tyrosine aminotransferase